MDFPPNVLEGTDVLIWWGHRAHEEASEGLVAKVKEQVLAGMGVIFLHSPHLSNIFTQLMGMSCCLKWCEVAEKERI